MNSPCACNGRSNVCARRKNNIPWTCSGLGGRRKRPINCRNSLYFERLGWQGLLIEPIPQLHQQCVVNRPGATVVNCACVADDSVTEIEMTFVNLMSLVKGAKRTSEEQQAWIERGERVQYISAYDLAVPARTLCSILDEYQIGHVDLLILDVEGYEKAVLAGLRLDRHRPRFLVVEEAYGDDIQSAVDEHYGFVAELSQHPNTHDLLFRAKERRAC